MIGRASSGVSRNASPEPSSDVCPLEVVGVQRSRKAWRWVRTRVGCVWVVRCLPARTVAGLRKMSTMNPSSVPFQSLCAWLSDLMFSLFVRTLVTRTPYVGLSIQAFVARARTHKFECSFREFASLALAV